MTKRCCYCNPPHIMGHDHGAPYTDGLCRWAFYKELVKVFFQYELPEYLAGIRRAVRKTGLFHVAALYTLAMLIRWAVK